MVLACAAFPTRAQAIEVMCENEIGGSCTISNDPYPTLDCTCDGTFVGGTTGGSENPWADFTEAELLEVCRDSLPTDCSVIDSSTGAGTGAGTGGETDVETGPVGSSNPSTDPSGPDSGDTAASDSGNKDDSTADKGCSVHGHAPQSALLIVPVLWRMRRRRRG